jgi:preprotein translocase subunit SecA
LNADDVKNNTEAENEILQRAGRVGAVTVATDMAGRGVDIRPDLYDDQRLAEAVAKATQPVAILAVDAHEAQRLAGGQFDKLPILTPGMAAPQGAVVLNEADFATGGLLVLGAERHDSRRIDNQLVGRSGRQGEPGTTQFAVSLDDQVIRDYAPKGLKGWLSHHGKGHEADGRGAHMVKKAQKKVEEVHASQRETTAKYEGPEAIQRQIIYDDRRSILDGHDLTPQILKWAGAAVDTLAEPYQGHGLFHRDGISRDDAMVLADSVHDMFGVTEGLSPEGGSLEHTVTALKDEVHHLYQRRETDAGGPEAMQDKARKVFIDALDKGWSEQIEDLGNLRDGIGYRGLAQVQPEDAYKIEARRLFDEMQVRVESETLENIFRPA